MGVSEVKYLQRARLASWALMVGAIVNCSFLVEGYVGSELNRRTSFISELSANGQPAQTFYRLSDLIAGTLLVIGGLACYRLLPDSPWVRIGDLSAVVVGLITAVNSFVPLDCTPSVSETCRAAEKAGQVSMSHQIHNVTGILEPIFGVAALVLIGIGLWRLRRSRRLPPQWTGLAPFLILVAALYGLMALLIAVIYLFNDPGGLGLAQRLQIVLYGSAIFAIGLVMRHYYDQESKRPDG